MQDKKYIAAKHWLLKEIKDPNKWRDNNPPMMCQFSWLICSFNSIPTKMLAGCFVEIDKLNVKLIWEFKVWTTVEMIWTKQTKVEYDFQIYHKTSNQGGL